MRVVTIVTLIASSLFGFSLAKDTLSFSGTISTASGFNVKANTGSNCEVEYEDTSNLGVNCTLNLGIGPANSWSYDSSFFGGIGFRRIDGGLEASLFYKLSLEDPFSSEPYAFPRSAATGSITIPFTKKIIDMDAPVAICLSNITKHIPSLDAVIATSIMEKTGSDICLSIFFKYAGNEGATFSLNVGVNLLDTSKSTSPTKLKWALAALQVDTNALPIKSDINVGSTIYNFITGINLSGSAQSSATAAKRMRRLASSQQTPSYMDDEGNFVLGKQDLSGKQGSLSVGAISGIVIGCMAALGLAAAGSVFYIRKYGVPRMSKI